LEFDSRHIISVFINTYRIINKKIKQQDMVNRNIQYTIGKLEEKYNRTDIPKKKIAVLQTKLDILYKNKNDSIAERRTDDRRYQIPEQQF